MSEDLNELDRADLDNHITGHYGEDALDYHDVAGCDDPDCMACNGLAEMK